MCVCTCYGFTTGYDTSLQLRRPVVISCSAPCLCRPRSLSCARSHRTAAASWSLRRGSCRARPLAIDRYLGMASNTLGGTDHASGRSNRWSLAMPGSSEVPPGTRAMSSKGAFVQELTCFYPPDYGNLPSEPSLNT